MVQLPMPLETALPTTVAPPMSSSIVLPIGPVPVNVGLATLVMLSVLELPLSDAVARSGALSGTVGPVIVTLRLGEGMLWLPAVSVARALMPCTPDDSVELVMVQ